MQTLPLPSLNASKAVTPKASSNLAVSTSNDAFKQALTQQVEQRQTLKNNAEAKAAERQAASRAAAPKPAQNARPAQPHNLDSTDKSAQPKPAQDQTAGPDNSTQAATPNPPAASANDGDRASSDAEAARTADPVADMLALMAAHNQPGAADGADAAVTDAAAAAAGQNSASSAVDTATLATLTTLTAAEADAAAKADATDISEPTARFNGAEFKAALGRAAADALPVQNAVAAKAAAPDSKLTSLGAELASQPGHHGAASAAGDVTAADTTVRPDAKADIVYLGQQLNATRERQADALNGVRTDAKAEAEAALAAKDVAPAVTAAATAAAAPEIAKAVAPATTLYSRVGTPAWDQQLGQKVVFMAAGGEHSATMELNPPDLGPLQVVLSVNKDQATAAFTSAAPEVRQALEAALPRLREMMGEAGIQLGNATVSAGTSDQNPSNQAASSGSGQRGAPGSSGQGGQGSVEGAEAPRTTIRRLPSGAVDTFA
jgi:flagellar hook-length control protein FliK